MTQVIEWRQDPIVPRWWQATVTIGQRAHRIAVSQAREQPEYWHLWRGTGNDPLLVGPCDLAGAQRYAAQWLREVCVACFASGYATGYRWDDAHRDVIRCPDCQGMGRHWTEPRGESAA